MYRLFCIALLALSFTLAASLAYTRHAHGRPALLDFDAISQAPAATLPAIRPPFYRLPDLPAAWLALNVLCGVAFGMWMLRRLDPAMTLLFAVFTPAIVSLLVGQDSLILLCVLTGVFVLLETQRPLLAGLLLTLLWVKFQFLPAFVLLLIVRREWRALAGFAAGSAVVLAPVASQLRPYIATLLHHAGDASVVPCRPCMPNLHALIPHFPLAAVASLILLAASATQFRRPLPQAFALALIAAPLAGMHTHVYDMVFLFLAVVVLNPAKSLLAAWAISPAPYLLPYFWSPLRITPALTALAIWFWALTFRPASRE